MNIFFALAIVFTSTFSMAFVGSNDSWSEILKAKSVSFLYEENLGGIDFRNACLTETEVKSIKPMKYCGSDLVPVKKGQNKDSFTDWVCQDWVNGIYSYPRTVVMNYCEKWAKDYDQNLSCVKETKRPVTVPQTIKVRVVQTTGSYSTYPGFSKLFTLPDCAN